MRNWRQWKKEAHNGGGNGAETLNVEKNHMMNNFVNNSAKINKILDRLFYHLKLFYLLL